MVRLAFGVVAGRGLGVWATGPGGDVLDASHGSLPPAAAVVVGPRRADADDVATALRGLAALVSAGGDIVAGADVDLGGGFRTGRVDGAPGDRRDAILAALVALGADGAARLGDRSAVLVALFGPTATKRLGAAATAAVAQGRFAALHLASAASDLLGPEQLEQLIGSTDLDGPMPVDPASALADELALVLEPFPRPRRLALLLDLCGVAAHARRNADLRRRLMQLRCGEEVVAQVRARYERHWDDDVSAEVGGGVAARPFTLARWYPQHGHWRGWVLRMMRDAMAATALLRTAAAVTEFGLVEGMTRSQPALATAGDLLTRREANAAGRHVPNLAPMPARPGTLVKEFATRMSLHSLDSERAAATLRGRLALAHAYAVVVLDAAGDLIIACHDNAIDLSQGWLSEPLHAWREEVGYTLQRPPHEWAQPPHAGFVEGTRYEAAPNLAARLAEPAPDGAEPAQPSDVEHPGDLLWYAELADVLARVEGHHAAQIDYGVCFPTVVVNPPSPTGEPLRPVDDSVPHAVSGAAQLIRLGAQAPQRPRTWSELVDGLMASTVVAAALTGMFRVPRELLDHDGATLPPASDDAAVMEAVRLELARDPHQLVDWANYMGNCIAGPYYLGEAVRGRSVLAALRRADGRVVANVELRPHRHGWHVGEFRARFNAEPPSTVDASLRAFVATLPAPSTRDETAPVVAPRRDHGSGHRRNRADRDLSEVRDALVPLVAAALAASEVVAAVAVLGRVGEVATADGGLAAVTALRRERPEELDATVRSQLLAGLDLHALWQATAVRPLLTALDGLQPALRGRTGHIEGLLGDEPLLGSTRQLGRTSPIAEARAVEVVARRLRRSLGRLARNDEPALAALVPRQADAGLLCALVLCVSTGTVAPRTALTAITKRGQDDVPGFPSSNVDDRDGPWWRARADAAELGAQLPRGRGRPALSLPTSWLGRGGWPALWSRVNR